MGHGALGVMSYELGVRNFPLSLISPMPNAHSLILRFLLKRFNISEYIDAKFSEVSQNPSSLLDCRSKLVWAKRCAS
ncbi:hypothetical protein NSTC745_01785 [Nostoc sp. DSM 114161]|jgi:hypothetical protein